MSQTSTRPDSVLKAAVIDATSIGVGVTDGAVTLSGEVRSDPEKRLAEKAVQRVKGVHAVAEEITVRTAHGAANDSDIAREAGFSLERAVDIAANAVAATVKDQVVTLAGTVPWRYQRELAERPIRHLNGVREVHNHIRVEARVSTTEMRKGIEAALVRHAVPDATRLAVSAASNGEVTIEGTVGTWAERAQVNRVAWAAPGATAVHNRVRVVD